MKYFLTVFLLIAINFHFTFASAQSYEPLNCWALVYKQTGENLSWSSRPLVYHSGGAAGPDAYFEDVADLKFLVVVNSSLDTPITEPLSLVYFIIDKNSGQTLSQKSVNLDLNHRYEDVLINYEIDINTYGTAQLGCNR